MKITFLFTLAEIYNRVKEAEEIMGTNQNPNVVSLANQARNQHSLPLLPPESRVS